MEKNLSARKCLKHSHTLHTYKNDITRLIRLYVDGSITELEYRENLKFLCDSYRNFRKEKLCVEL